jgi:predicted RNase H-like nuclease (RuvC/YqgF family)
MKHWLLYLVAILAFSACGNKENDAQQAQDALETEVMALHDEAMADMGKIYRLRRNLSSLRDTLQAQSGDTATINLLTRRIQELNDADEAMMDWMRRYQAPDTLAHDQAMNYLQEEHEKMARVKALMDSTIANAKKTYTQHEQK